MGNSPTHAYIISHNFEFFTSFLQKLKIFCKIEKVFEDSENNMKKEEFLKLLHAKLIERGVDKATAEKETSHVRTYLTESGTEDLNVSLDEMVDGIISMIESGKQEKSGTKRAAPIVTKAKEKDSHSDEFATASKNVDDRPRRAPKTTDHKPEEKKPNEKDAAKERPAEKTNEAPRGSENKDGENRSLLWKMMSRVDKIIKKLQNKDKKQKKNGAENKPKSTRKNEDDIEEYFPLDKKAKIQYTSDGKMRNEWLYVAILVFAIPIAVALILISVVLYIGFWIALALVMIACITVLVVFVTAGSLVSIVGIVFGVVQLISGNTPVGLFEVGLGVIVGAAVMFVGILIYNFAVRFIPFGMKLLAKLLKLGFRALRYGYNVLKGAVSDI